MAPPTPSPWPLPKSMSGWNSEQPQPQACPPRGVQNPGWRPFLVPRPLFYILPWTAWALRWCPSLSRPSPEEKGKGEEELEQAGCSLRPSASRPQPPPDPHPEPKC